MTITVLKRALVVIVLLLSISAALWKCHYGFDLYDESFYLPAGFKLFSLGDRPFRDEINNGPRQLDILNFLLVRPWVPYSVLKLRQASVLFYAFCLSCLALASFRRKFNLLAALLLGGLISFDFLLVNTWSHDHWCRNFLILHMALLILAHRRLPKGLFFMGLAGAAFGIAAIAYNPILVAPLGGLVGVFVLHHFRKKQSPGLWKMWLAYSVGLFAILGADALYLARPSVWPFFRQALAATSSVPDYARNLSPAKAYLLLIFLITRVEAWIALLGVFIISRQRKGGPTPGRWIAWAGVLLSILYLAVRLIVVKEPGTRALSGWIGIAVAGAFVLMYEAWKESREIPFYAVGVTSAIMGVMAMASSGANGASVWAAPAIILPFLAFIVERTPGPYFRRVSPDGVLFLSLLIAVGTASLWSELTRTYKDVTPAECISGIKVPPLEGIKTSIRRAFLLEKLAEYSAGKKFVFTDGALPVVYLFGEARSSLNTIFADTRFTPQIKTKQFSEMVENNREPQLLIKPKRHAYEWGYGVVEVFVNKDDPYDVFYECAKSNRLAQFFEFDAYESDPARSKECIKKMFLSEKLAVRP
jgi:hypothetical protein